MSDPRLTLDYQGQNANFMTYKIDNSTITYLATSPKGSAAADDGLVVTLSADDTVKLIEDGEGIEGMLFQVTDDNYAVVQIDGAMKLPKGNGATITRGKKLVGALGAAGAKGYVRDVATGTAAELGVARGRTVRATADADGKIAAIL